VGRKSAFVADVLKATLPPESRRRIFSVDLIRLKWPEIVGKELAERSEPASLGLGMLTVRVSEPAWGREIVRHRKEIVARLAAVVGWGVVRSVQFVRDGTPLWESEPRWSLRSRPQMRTGPVEPSEIIVEAAGSIEDSELRTLVTRTASRYLAAQAGRSL
jgi:hypothetical protein